jgi:hypothetical protein
MKTVEGFQLDFISYIQRLLSEGDFASTYKFALLHALADICVEKPAQSNTELMITHDEIIEKFIQIYWQHAKPFTGTKAGALLQNNGNQVKIITDIQGLQSLDLRNINEAKEDKKWSKIYSNTKRILKDGPLWRLQILSRNEECFLYPHDKKSQFIILNKGIADCFRRFYDLILHLTRQSWLNKVVAIPFNQKIIGRGSEVQDFLFGTNRKSIVKAVPVLREIQSGNCFYCEKSIKHSPEVDHFIPFAKYPNDLGHNFVLAHSSCNNNKRDYLASNNHKDNWFKQNIYTHSKLIEDELSSYFTCDVTRTEEVANWAYQVATKNQSRLWQSRNKFV